MVVRKARKAPGQVRHAANGVCEACASAQRREELEKRRELREELVALAALALASRPSFMDAGLGACAGMDVELFYSDTVRDIQHAEAICGGCPFRVECLEWAVNSRELWGVWGMTTLAERRPFMTPPPPKVMAS